MEEEKQFDELWRSLGLHLGYKNKKDEKIKAFIKENYVPRSKLLEIVLEIIGEKIDIENEWTGGYNTAKAEIRTKIAEL